MANLHVLTYEGLKNYTTKFLAKITATFAKITDLNAHKSDTAAHMSSTQKSQLSSAYSHSTSAHAPSNAQPNQNAFSNISVGGTTIAADNATDTLTVAGSNVTLTPDSTNDKVTIGITKANVTAALGYTPPTTDTKYTHPSYTAHGAGLYKTTVDSTGHVSAVTAVTKSDITALGIPGQDTHYGAAGTTLGLVKTGGDVTIASGVMSVNDNSHNHTVANVTGLQSALDGKAPIKSLQAEDLNTVVTPGFYHAGGGNTITNKPSGIEHFGLIVIHRASGNYYTQILYNDTSSYRRMCNNGTWTSWTQDKLTDTVRGVQNNLTSTSTTDALTAAQGKILKDLVDGKAPTGHTHSNYVNQNAFSNVVVGTTTMAADTATDTLTLVAGSNVTLTPDATNDKITIAAKDTTYGAASTSANGLMTSAMVTKLNGIADGANKYVLPTAAKDVLGGVKTSSEVTSASGYTACPIIAGIPYYKDTNTTYNLGSFGVTATANELNCTKGATSNLQTQINTINSTLFNRIYPIGSIYMSTQNTNPSTLFGGTWIAWGTGRVPIGVDTTQSAFNTVEKTGGTYSINLVHSHTVNSHSHSSPAHSHPLGNGWAKIGRCANYLGGIAYKTGLGVGSTRYDRAQTNGGGISGGDFAATDTVALGGNTSSTTPGNTGSASPGTNNQLSSSQSIIQPYITCYMWKRTA